MLALGCALVGLPAAETVHEAIAAAHYAEAQAMMTADPALVNARNAQQMTPLHVAAARGNDKLVAWLLEKGAAVDAADDQGVTAVQLAAQNNSLPTVKVLVEHGANLSVRDKRGRNALGAAYSHPWAAIVDYIKQAQATDTPPGVAPRLNDALKAALAATDLNRLKAALKAEPEQVWGRDENGRTPLMLAVQANAVPLAQELLAQAAAPNAVDRDGQTALMQAVLQNNPETVRLLMEKGADPALADKTGRRAADMAQGTHKDDILPLLASAAPASPPAGPVLATPEFSKAVLDNRLPEVQKMLEQNPSLANSIDKNGFPMFVQAASSAYAKMLTMFLDAGTRIDIQDPEGMSALHRAAKNGSMECVKLLVERGANLQLKNQNGNTAEQVAAKRPHPEIAAYLKDVAGGRIAPGGAAGLLQAIGTGNLPEVEKLIAATPAIADQADARGRTPLYFAVTGKVEIVAFLLKQQVNVNQTDDQNWRPIHVAAEAGRADVVKLLIAQQADPNAGATTSTQTPLHIAAAYGFTEVAKLLLAAQADPNLPAAGGVTALHRAASGGYVDIVSLLILAKADTDRKDAKGQTPLDYATGARRGDVIALLTGGGTKPPGASIGGPASRPGPKSDPNAKLDPVKAKAFLEAAKKPDYTVMEALLKEDINLVHARAENNGDTVLHLLAHRGNAEWMAKIIDWGLPFDTRHKYGRTPLHRSAEFGNAECVKLLLERGADFNAKDSDNWTPLHHAAKNASDEPKFRQTLETLLKYKPDATLKDNNGLTPYGEAKLHNRPLAIAILEAHGIKE